MGMGNDMDEIHRTLCKEQFISNFEYVCRPNKVSTHNGFSFCRFLKESTLIITSKIIIDDITI
jgi:hypothetical protein